MSTTDDQVEKEVVKKTKLERVKCPLCMEQLDLDELNFFPCKCGYQVCQFCWNRIKQEENGLCPACRQPYPDQPVDFKPFSAEELKKIQQERRKREQQRKQKMSENRKHLANMRVVQKNLVLVHGMPPRLCDPESLRKFEYFGQFGKIQKIAFGTNNPPTNATSSNSSISQTASASVYVTYSKEEEAVKAIMALNQRVIDGKILRASLGTTKYCSCFLQNKPCQKTDCMYLHEVADAEASFTKEDMATKRHEDYERKVCEEILLRITSTNSILQQRGDVFPCSSTSLEANSLSHKTSRDSSVTPHSQAVTISTNDQPAVAAPVASSPVAQAAGEYSRAYRGTAGPRHHKKHDHVVKNASNSPVDTSVQEVQRNSTLGSINMGATKSVMCSPTACIQPAAATSSAEHEHCNHIQSVSITDSAPLFHNHPPPTNVQTSSALASQQPTSFELSAARSSPLASSVATFFRQQTTGVPNQQANISSLHSSGQSQTTTHNQQQTAHSSSFFSNDDDSSYFYKQRLKPSQHNEQKIPGSEESLAMMAALGSGSSASSSLLDFILGANSMTNKNTGQSDHHPHQSSYQQQNLANGLSLNTGNVLLERFSNNLSSLNSSSIGPVFRTTSEPAPRDALDSFHLIGNSLNIKTQKHADWQTAFGFSKSDDDLGFDPISESSKALEDLLREEKEKEENQKRRVNMMAATQRITNNYQQQSQGPMSNQQIHQLPQNHVQSQAQMNAGLKQISQKFSESPSQLAHQTSNLWQVGPSNSVQSHAASSLFAAGTSASISAIPPYHHETQSQNSNFTHSALFRYNNHANPSEFTSAGTKVLNVPPPGTYNGLNAQAAPFIPRQVNPSGLQGQQQTPQNQSLSVKDMQEQFRSFFPDASVKFQLSSSMPPATSVIPPQTSTGLRPVTGWPGSRTVDPRQNIFSRPPPPIVPQSAPVQTNLPPPQSQICFPSATRPSMKLSNPVEIPSFHHQAHSRVNVPGSTSLAPFGAPPSGAGPMFTSDYSGWSLTPTPPPGFAPSSHQSPS